jgi:uncharacterized membrane protein
MGQDKYSALLVRAVAGAVAVSSGAAYAVVSVHALPYSTSYTVALDVSNGGAFVTGYGENDHVPAVPLLWSGGSSPVNIEGTSGLTNALGEHISADGSVVVGRYGSAPTRMYRWTSGTGMVPLQSPALLAPYWVNDICGDGSTAVGNYSTQDGHTYAAVWDQAGSLYMRSPGYGDVNCSASGVSYGGGIIVGRTSNAAGAVRAARWNPGQYVATTLATLPGMTVTGASAVSADGSVVVGATGTGNYDSYPLMWDGLGNLTVLPLLPGNVYGAATEVSADGSVILGVSWSPSVSERSVLWVNGQLIALDNLLISNGVSPSLAASLNATGLSADGRYLSAYVNLPGGTSRSAPYLVEVPAPSGLGAVAVALLVAAKRRRR